MFTGIIQGKFPVVEMNDLPGLKRFAVEFSPALVNGLKTGASIAIDGVCFTAVKIENMNIFFDAMEETLRKSTIGQLKKGDQVNIERSAKFSDEIGGHVMSGHVSTMAEIIDVEVSENNKVFTFKVDPVWMKYIFSKGFIGLDGASLTIVDAKKEEGTFKVWFIPETLRLTRFGEKTIMDKVNVEIDSTTQTIVETIENYLQQNTQ